MKFYRIKTGTWCWVIAFEFDDADVRMRTERDLVYREDEIAMFPDSVDKEYKFRLPHNDRNMTAVIFRENDITEIWESAKQPNRCKSCGVFCGWTHLCKRCLEA